MTEQEQRAAVVSEALTWLRTPYHLNASVKGAGVDCGTFLIAAFHGVGLIDHVDLGMFKPDFHLHRSSEVYLDWVGQYCEQVDRDPLPGDIVLYRYGRIVAHGVLVIDWPRVIHAKQVGGVQYADALQPSMATRQDSIHSFWGGGNV